MAVVCVCPHYKRIHIQIDFTDGNFNFKIDAEDVKEQGARQPGVVFQVHVVGGDFQVQQNVRNFKNAAQNLHIGNVCEDNQLLVKLDLDQQLARDPPPQEREAIDTCVNPAWDLLFKG